MKAHQHREQCARALPRQRRRRWRQGHATTTASDHDAQAITGSTIASTTTSSTTSSGGGAVFANPFSSTNCSSVLARRARLYLLAEGSITNLLLPRRASGGAGPRHHSSVQQNQAEAVGKAQVPRATSIQARAQPPSDRDHDNNENESRLGCIIMTMSHHIMASACIDHAGRQSQQQLRRVYERAE
jgi:hypothetical protein